MPLPNKLAETVVFVVAMREARGEAEPIRTPIGTAFLALPDSTTTRDLRVYVVTAGHVVASGEATWLRFNRMGGGVVDLEIRDWLNLDPNADVAVAPINPPRDANYSCVPVGAFLDAKSDVQPALGDDVYFIGLLPRMRSMAEDNVPMVRSGTLGRLLQRDVPLKREDGTILNVTGHLIDCRSYSGFSGSPCFIQFTRRHPGIPDAMMGVTDATLTPLLGLISGHWEDPQRARPTGGAFQTGSLEYSVNTGVGVVTPVESIRQALTEADDLGIQ